MNIPDWLQSPLDAHACPNRGAGAVELTGPQTTHQHMDVVDVVALVAVEGVVPGVGIH